VRQIYMKFVEEGRLTRIDGNRSESEVAEDVYAIVTEFLKRI